jgi:hypothetical protein
MVTVDEELLAVYESFNGALAKPAVVLAINR